MVTITPADACYTTRFYILLFYSYFSIHSVFSELRKGDVYKRQVPGYRKSQLCLTYIALFCVSDCRQVEPEISVPVITDQQAVSYTHLDVYKRQLLYGTVTRST